jgi:hypothetical protein
MLVKRVWVRQRDEDDFYDVWTGYFLLGFIPLYLKREIRDWTSIAK